VELCGGGGGVGWRGWADASSVGDMAAMPDDRDEVRLRVLVLLKC
jgi:hypothetical protein